MMNVDLHLGLFTEHMGRELSERAALLLLRAFATIDLDYLRTHPEVKGPYDNGLQYIREIDTQHWLGVSELNTPRRVNGPSGPTMARGGDCKDLSTYAVAWYYVRGERTMKQAQAAAASGQAGKARALERVARYLKSAKIDLVKNHGDGFFQYHVRVKWPQGKIEDPSAILGMNRNGLAELP